MAGVAIVTPPARRRRTPEERIERAAAVATVKAYGADAVWIAPTERGAILRASRCLALGIPADEVRRALELRSP